MRLQFFFLFIIVCAYSVGAVGIGVNPGKFRIDFAEDKTITKEILVINTGTAKANYEIYVDESFNQQVFFSNDNFSLDINEAKIINITFLPVEKSEAQPFTIYILGSPNSVKANVASGIRIPVNVKSFLPKTASRRMNSITGVSVAEVKGNHLYGIIIALLIPITGVILFTIIKRLRR